MVDPAARKPLTDDWTVPRPPPEVRRPPGLRGIRISTGIVIALAAHLLTVLALYVTGAAVGGDWLATAGLRTLLWEQVLLGAGCLLTGLLLAIRRRDGGVGIGLVIGWAAGVPVVVYLFFASWLFSGIGGA